MCTETVTAADTCKRTENQPLTDGSVCCTNVAVYRVSNSVHENSVKVTAGYIETTGSRLQFFTLAHISINVTARYTGTQLDQCYCSLH